ncbi:transcriptional regulator protein [Halorhabdus tiamatea SARL4B]|uniref:Transcriptional regulator protein n=1 Tax=Halorhabdus tiamatea SARL4B TaxID=1033806 RepID=F7PM40_9EURY|nr:hypothetical protein [Halorhabdus tiamatea]ERJ06352.1 transcriptional regulator protein [Halorhabdus tiamatea SARL4B]CCQ34520.1 hypothetical protein HTIA_2412 [Halorhabdus tiamatea SARL4B]
MGERPSDLETVRSRLNVVTQETRFSLLQDILGHPDGLDAEGARLRQTVEEQDDDSPAPRGTGRRPGFVRV